jgi:hypothetical protein
MAVLTGLLLTAAACGNDDGDETLSDSQADLAAGLLENFDATSAEAGGIDQEDADCVANSIASVFSDERIDELGLTREAASATDFNFDGTNLTEEEQAGVTAAMTTCINFEQLLVDSFNESGEVSEESVACLLDQLPEGYYEDRLAAGLFGGGETGPADEDFAVLTEALTQCLSEEELGGIGG